MNADIELGHDPVAPPKQSLCAKLNRTQKICLISAGVAVTILIIVGLIATAMSIAD